MTHDYSHKQAGCSSSWVLLGNLTGKLLRTFQHSALRTELLWLVSKYANAANKFNVKIKFTLESGILDLSKVVS